MPIQTATTGQLDKAQAVMIGEMRFTAEHSAPCKSLIDKATLPKGYKQLTWPKVGQMSAAALTDGLDLIASEDIGMTYVDLTASEVGLKVILTDKLVRQEQDDVFRIVGRQMGDAMGRKLNRDIIALFAALNGGTVLGADNKDMAIGAVTGLCAFAKANKFPNPVSIVHHPNAVVQFVKSAAGIGCTYYAGIMQGLPEELLRNFWKGQVNGVNIFETGDIDKITGYDSGYGAIFSKNAMVYVEALAPNVERERDASLRGTEVIIVSDYGVFEVEDTYGAACQYEIGAVATST
jgi:hypothetical protein